MNNTNHSLNDIVQDHIHQQDQGLMDELNQDAVQAAYHMEEVVEAQHELEPIQLPLRQLGWDERWEQAWSDWLADLNESAARRYGGALVPARVALAHKGLYRVWGEGGEWLAEPSGQARAMWQAPSDYPAVGDWVAVAPRAAEGRATIAGVLPRRGLIARKVAGNRRDAQVIAANADIALLVSSLGLDFEPRRMERYATLAYDSGAMPVVVLTKADTLSDANAIADYTAQAMSVVPGAPVYPVSSVTGDGLDALHELLAPGVTCVLVGSSGVGKSTLVNALTGKQVMATKAIREDDGKGRHTTTHRELVPLSNGAWLLDTPGMREVGLVASDEASGDGLQHAFEDIEQFAEACRFGDCKHKSEPGCAVQAAITTGELEPSRLKAYFKLQRELAHMQRTETKHAIRAHGKQLNKQYTAVQRSNHKSKQR
ncbi:ribosome small subunit-dependent GTPase A [Paenibacillus marinisediminis]